MDTIESAIETAWDILAEIVLFYLVNSMKINCIAVLETSGDRIVYCKTIIMRTVLLLFGLFVFLELLSVVELFVFCYFAYITTGFAFKLQLFTANVMIYIIITLC